MASILAPSLSLYSLFDSEDKSKCLPGYTVSHPSHLCESLISNPTLCWWAGPNFTALCVTPCGSENLNFSDCSQDVETGEEGSQENGQGRRREQDAAIEGSTVWGSLPVCACLLQILNSLPSTHTTPVNNCTIVHSTKQRSCNRLKLYAYFIVCLFLFVNWAWNKRLCRGTWNYFVGFWSKKSEHKAISVTIS
jgi:hypothetical protein